MEKIEIICQRAPFDDQLSLIWWQSISSKIVKNSLPISKHANDVTKQWCWMFLLCKLAVKSKCVRDISQLWPSPVVGPPGSEINVAHFLEHMSWKYQDEKYALSMSVFVSFCDDLESKWAIRVPPKKSQLKSTLLVRVTALH